MPDPDATRTGRAFADGAVTSRILAADLVSDNYVQGSSGWMINRATGDVEFNNAVFRGRVEASVVVGGIIKTAASGNRVELNGLTNVDSILFYTGDAAEGGRSSISSVVNGSGATRTIQAQWFAPNFDGVGSVFLIARSESFDDTSTAPGFIFGSSSGSSQRPWIFLQGDMSLDFGVDSQLKLPTATSRPSSPANGWIYMNTSTNLIEAFEGGSWRTIGSW